MEKIELPIAEDNISPMKPDWKRLGRMLGIIIVIIIIVQLLLMFISSLFISALTLEEEKNLFGDFLKTEEQFDMKKLKHSFDSPYDIYILDEEYEANAYALPGTMIYITTQLLEELKYEEELIFILGHEIAHINNRDIIEMYSHDIPFRFTLASLGFDSVLEGISFSKITGNYLSQEKEKNADKGGIELINSLELNLNCSTGFFERNDSIDPIFTTLLSTHPSSESRIKNIKNSALHKTECTPLKY